jgi:uncharacterized SAM-binding protein YcdF (DUF218 family)
MTEAAADAIFVFAGRESRKRFGLRLFREGIAGRLVLSVGRFEWRRFASLGLPNDGGLSELVSKTEPKVRHFFVDIRSESARSERIPTGALGTWSEARALSRFVERERIEKLLVISHRQHLRRCLLALELVLPRSCDVVPVAAPDDPEEPPASRWMEAFKFLCYSALLGPIWICKSLFSRRLRRARFPDIKSGFTLSQPGLREGDFRPPEAANAPTPPGVAADGRGQD